MTAVAEAVAADVIGGRLWLYSNYHCNLICSYCLTESAPGVPRREIPAPALVARAAEARAAGFTSLGVTGGEPFLLPGLPAALAAMSAQLPTLVLSNGTLFSRRLVDELRPLAGPDFAIQISLDSAEPEVNDGMRGPRNHARVLAAIPRLADAGIRVRLATTSDSLDGPALARLCELHRGLGVPDADHVVRPIVRRGRAAGRGLGREARREQLPAELTLTADGAFWSPFGPTVRGGRLDTDLLVTRTTSPLSAPAAAMIRLAAGSGSGAAERVQVR